MKLLQNKIAESGLTLPVTALYAIVVWLLAGVVKEQWWGQLACFILSAALLAELNNSNALIRVRSRLVSSTFLALSCAACFLFESMQGGIVQLCCVASYLILFRTYQDKEAVGWTFYAFFCLGLASMAFVPVIFLMPVLWLLMATNLLSLSWRTWTASLIGVLTPYWLTLPYFIYMQDFMPLADHLAGLGAFSFPFDYSTLTVGQVLVFAFVLLLAAAGSMHLWRYGYEDSIRVRLLYGCFMGIDAVVLLFVALQPQHYQVLMPLAIINTSPIIAHFLALTHTRITNILFFVIVGAVVLLTAFNLWMPSLTF